MTGRLEREQKMLKAIENRLLQMPPYIRDYYYWLGNNKTVGTRHVYINKIWQFLSYCRDVLDINIDKPGNLNEVKPGMIGHYLWEENVKPATKGVTHAACYSFFHYLEANEYINKNPWRFVEAPVIRQDKENNPLTPQQIDKIRKNLLNPRERPGYLASGMSVYEYRQTMKNMNILWFDLALTTGLRISSTIEINIDDFTDDYRELHVIQKGNKVHRVMIGDTVRKELFVWLKDREKILRDCELETDALFINLNGKRMDTLYFSRLLNAESYNLNRKVTPHDLRRTCGTMLYSKTGDIYLVAHTLGHSDPKTTTRYAKVGKEKEKRASNIMENYVTRIENENIEKEEELPAEVDLNDEMEEYESEFDNTNYEIDIDAGICLEDYL